MELHLVADTNLFFECKSLEQLPWAELDYDLVVILLTKPVLDEIDKHKKAKGRTRARALEIFGRVRNMLANSAKEAEIRPSAPRVLLRRMSRAKPDPSLKEFLDYTRNDDKLIGIVAALNAETPGQAICLFTDDTGPCDTADGLGVPFLMINETWRRPPSETTEEKRIKELEKNLSTYRSQEPQITIACNTADSSNLIVAVSHKVATPLSQEEVSLILEALCLKHPMTIEFTPPAPFTKPDGSGGTVTVEYVRPADTDVSNYCNVRYPGWVEECHRILTKLHEHIDERGQPVLMQWSMSNGGTRPASQVRIEFEARGSLVLRRLSKRDEDDSDGDSDDIAAAESNMGPAARFPSVPRPPAFQEKITRVPSPTTATPGKGLDLATLSAGGVLQRGSPLFRMSSLDAMREAVRGTYTHAHLDSLTIPSPLIPDPHDPEGFYYDWPRTHAVEKGALTCDLWRHQTTDELFEFEVLFTTPGDTRGIVECTVHAGNLTKPERVKVVVVRKIDPVSMLAVGTTMVEASE